MQGLSRAVGTTSQIIEIYVTSSATGAGLAGLTYNSGGLVCYYKRNTAASSTLVSLASATLGSYTSGGFKEVDSGNMPGLYEFGIPNAALASGADRLTIIFLGATNMVPVVVDVDLTQTSNQDGVRGGMTALPNANAAATGGLATVDSTNSVKIQAPVKRNTALTLAFVMQGPTGLPLAGLGSTITAQRSIDNGSFAACTNTPSELNYGSYTVSLSAADLNGSSIMLRFSAAGAKDTFVWISTGA